MGSTRRKDWIARALSSATSEDHDKAAEVLTLALAPVKPSTPYYPPLIVTEATPVVHVTFDPVVLSQREQGDAPTHERHAGMRAYLTEATDWGHEVVRVAALLFDGNEYRTVVLEGPESAIRHAFPDELMLAAWIAAGAVEVTAVVGEHPVAPWLADARRVPATWAPRVVQMERLGREAPAQV